MIRVSVSNILSRLRLTAVLAFLKTVTETRAATTVPTHLELKEIHALQRQKKATEIRIHVIVTSKTAQILNNGLVASFWQVFGWILAGVCLGCLDFGKCLV
jgi:hypothetical protein